MALRRCRAPERSSLALLMTGLAVLLEHGGPAAVAVERLGDTIRSGIGARAEARAQAGQVLASATLLAVLPFPVRRAGRPGRTRGRSALPAHVDRSDLCRRRRPQPVG